MSALLHWFAGFEADSARFAARARVTGVTEGSPAGLQSSPVSEVDEVLSGVISVLASKVRQFLIL